MNQLGSARSAYLKSAAHQPVHWREWSDEAFAAANASGRPVLLDIGAVWCHWCHVMDGESYEDPQLAEYLNQHFVCVKVDRDERPDVDARYQRAVQAITGQGGWPLTAFLTPDGEIFYGGTYFPPDERYGRPGFRTVLEQVIHFWTNQRPRAVEQSKALRHALATRTDPVAAGRVSPSMLLAAERQILVGFDPAFGGFGSAPKFPHPGALRFLMARWADGGSSHTAHVARETLLAMARGGICDQLGGGFHRYSVDRQWVVPHFEKMSYDNSELLTVYVEGAMLFEPGAEEFRATARGIVGWVREVLAPAGAGYGTSQDADVGPNDDGSYFTWTLDEMADALDRDELEVTSRRFGLGTSGAMPHDPERNVLYQARTIEEVAQVTSRPVEQVTQLVASAIGKLRDARNRRPAPAVDSSRYASWNAMMAGAMLRAAPVLDDDWARSHALRTLVMLAGGDSADPDLLPARPAVPLPHAPGVDGLLEDQVHTADAAIDAFEATAGPGWLSWAATLMEYAWESHRAPGSEGLFDLAVGRAGPGLLNQGIRSIEDAPVPSANAVAARVCARLAGHLGNGPWAERHRALVEAFAGTAPGMGLHAATWLGAADWLLHPPSHLVITGPAGDETAQAMHRAALAAVIPRKVVRRLYPDEPTEGLPAELRAMLQAGGGPRGYLCRGTQCDTPADTAAGWQDLLRSASRRLEPAHA
jgi:uncharacterized protein YyaL (SSP411 family)